MTWFVVSFSSITHSICTGCIYALINMVNLLFNNAFRSANCGWTGTTQLWGSSQMALLWSLVSTKKESLHTLWPFSRLLLFLIPYPDLSLMQTPGPFLSDTEIDRILLRSSTGSDLRTLVLGMLSSRSAFTNNKLASCYT